MSELRYFKTHDPADCCGCRACEQICGHGAITMADNDEGFSYPVLHTDACTECGLCSRVCPMEHSERTLHPSPQAAVAAQGADTEEVLESSSGGIFSIIARHVLESGGVVYGAAFTDGAAVGHVRIESVDALPRLRGSKYVQSDTLDTFRSVRADLRAGRLVYYTGVACQIAGLRLFLMKDYDGLITSDLVCHGTPSPRVFATTVDHLEKRLGGTMADYSFRDKKVKGWSCSSTSSKFRLDPERLKYLIYAPEMEAYFNAFIAGDLMRMNCYRCPFTRTERPGDITLADFWGVKQYLPDFPAISRGVSQLLVNTDKGRRLMEAFADKLTTREFPIEWAVKTNANLDHPTPLTPRRAESYPLAFNDYAAFVRRYAPGPHFKANAKRHIEYFIRRHPALFRAVSRLKRALRRH